MKCPKSGFILLIIIIGWGELGITILNETLLSYNYNVSSLGSLVACYLVRID